MQLTLVLVVYTLWSATTFYQDKSKENEMDRKWAEDENGVNSSLIADFNRWREHHLNELQDLVMVTPSHTMLPC